MTFEEKMETLRKRFAVKAAVVRLGLIRACEADDLGELRREAHVLSGSGAIFGYSAVSDAAALLEQAVDQKAPLEEICDRCSALVELLSEIET